MVYIFNVEGPGHSPSASMKFCKVIKRREFLVSRVVGARANEKLVWHSKRCIHLSVCIIPVATDAFCWEEIGDVSVACSLIDRPCAIFKGSLSSLSSSSLTNIAPGGMMLGRQVFFITLLVFCWHTSPIFRSAAFVWHCRRSMFVAGKALSGCSDHIEDVVSQGLMQHGSMGLHRPHIYLGLSHTAQSESLCAA